MGSRVPSGGALASCCGSVRRRRDRRLGLLPIVRVGLALASVVTLGLTGQLRGHRAPSPSSGPGGPGHEAGGAYHTVLKEKTPLASVCRRSGFFAGPYRPRPIARRGRIPALNIRRKGHLGSPSQVAGPFAAGPLLMRFQYRSPSWNIQLHRVPRRRASSRTAAELYGHWQTSPCGCHSTIVFVNS
jgi:hypothetical protein